jgi:hypothetical protein
MKTEGKFRDLGENHGIFGSRLDTEQDRRGVIAKVTFSIYGQPLHREFRHVVSNLKFSRVVAQNILKYFVNCCEKEGIIIYSLILRAKGCKTL